MAAYVDAHIPSHTERFNRALLVGSVMAAWVLQEHSLGVINLGDNHGQYISNFGTHLANKLGIETVSSLVDQLSIDGVITPPPWASS